MQCLLLGHVPKNTVNPDLQLWQQPAKSLLITHHIQVVVTLYYKVAVPKLPYDHTPLAIHHHNTYAPLCN